MRTWLTIKSHVENDETTGTEYPTEYDSAEGDTNPSALPNFMPQLLPDDEIADGINSLNWKQMRSLQWGLNMGQRLCKIW